MLQETLIEVTRRERNQDELESFVEFIRDEVENLLGKELKFRVRAGTATSSGCSVTWEVGASKFSVNLYVSIRPKEHTELHSPDIITRELLSKPEALLWTALGELGYERFARYEVEGHDFPLYHFRNRIAESDNFVALFEIPPVRLEDC
jgi:hypothetical protein